MIENKLEILIITYNRSRDLENTFKYLLDSPFLRCKLTVLDNCSTDATPQICSKYQKLFPNMTILRHKRNIGGNPNILRAVETSTSKYTWILCDDDSYDFTDCSDVIAAIESDNFDIIMVSKHFMYGWEKGLVTTAKELIDKGTDYYHTLSFVPATIFKTEHYDSKSIYEGYYNVPNLYPHFPFINKSVEDDFSIYVSKKEIVKPGTHNQAVFSQLSWLISWMKSCFIIKDKKIRKDAIYFFNSFSRGLGTLFWAITIEKLRKNPVKNNTFILITEFILNYGFSKEQIFLLFIIPMALIPSFIFKYIVKMKIFLEEKILNKEVSQNIKDLVQNKEINIEKDILRS